MRSRCSRSTSPPRRKSASVSSGKLKKIEASGGTPQTLCDAPGPRGGSWGAAGTILFSAYVGGEIDRVPETGGQPVKLAHLVARGVEFFRWPFFLPDGRHFLYFDFTGDERVRGIHVGSIDSPETSRLVAADAGAAYAPPGYLLFRVGDRLMKQLFDADRLRVMGEASPVVDDVWWDSLSTLATAVSVSGNGVLAYQTGGLSRSRLLWLDRAGREVGVAGPPGAYIEPALSPDGKWVAVTRGEPDSGRVNVWMIDLERGSLSPASSSHSAVPIWSPDGKRIAYATFPSGGVYVQEAHGGGGSKLLFPTKSFTPLSDWSRDGRFVFYDDVDWRTFHPNLEVRELQPGLSKRVSEATWDETTARLSPDGRWLAYGSNESGSNEIIVRSFPASGDRRQVSVGGGTQPAWRGDGRELFYISPDGRVMAVDIRTEPRFEAGTPRALFQTRILPLVEARNNYDVTADGQRFLVNSRRPEDASLPVTVVVPWVSGGRP